MQKGFLFDLNKCTGCNACQIACSIENEVEFPMNWRQVNTFNNAKHPEISYFHLSTACNHCLDPPCLKYCPALAISKDQLSGTVIIDQDKCIGCKYCSWVCPYDAPTFNPSKKIMEKCTFCLHRLEENLPPACVTLCPTSALQITDHQEDTLSEQIAGFTKSEIKPAISFIPLRDHEKLPEISELPFDEITIKLFKESLLHDKKKEKISWLAEWPLVIFSILLALIPGIFTAGTLTPENSSNLLPVILGFIGLGVIHYS
jgi:DMSO reductase iron-sulfur subunit